MVKAVQAKWRKVFTLTLEKITRAGALKRGTGSDVPALEDPPVRPYVNDDKMTVERNNIARVRWEFQEEQLVVARQDEKNEAASKEKARAARQAAADYAEAKLYLTTLQSSFASLVKADTEQARP